VGDRGGADLVDVVMSEAAEHACISGSFVHNVQMKNSAAKPHPDSWSVQDARARFGDVIDAALRGQPQRVTRRGKETVVVVSEADWTRTAPSKPRMSFGEFLTTFPLTSEEWAEVAPQRHPHRPSPFADEE
jgi:antitoxin Phd